MTDRDVVRGALDDLAARRSLRRAQRMARETKASCAHPLARLDSSTRTAFCPGCSQELDLFELCWRLFAELGAREMAHGDLGFIDRGNPKP